MSTVPQALGRLRVALDAAYERASRECGLSAQQAELICAAMRPTAVGDLARILRCDRSNVSRLVDRAGARGLVARRGDASDGRVTVVELTPDGQALAERFIARLEEDVAPLLEAWPAERRADVAATLHEIADAIAGPDAPVHAPVPSGDRAAARP